MSTPARPKSAGKPPAPRLLKSWQDAEDYAAEYVRWLGWADAQATRRTGDEGIDVLAGSGANVLVAQVKMEVKEIESKVVRDLRGAGIPLDAKHYLMFALAGYKKPAIDWADKAGVALFEFAYDGSVEAVNDRAAALVAKAGTGKGRAAKKAPAPRVAPTPKGAAADLTERERNMLSVVEKWERADGRQTHQTMGLWSEEMASLAGTNGQWAVSSLPTLRRYLVVTRPTKDTYSLGGNLSYYVQGLKPAGLKALRDWGIPVQKWRD